jgi:hypothetical protein
MRPVSDSKKGCPRGAATERGGPLGAGPVMMVVMVMVMMMVIVMEMVMRDREGGVWCHAVPVLCDARKVFVYIPVSSYAMLV